MCNTLFKDETFQKIPSRGIGWKLVTHSNTALCTNFYNKIDDYFTWDTDIRGDGFMFFRTKKDAKDAQETWNKAVYVNHLKIRKINYKQGQGSCIMRDDSFGVGARAYFAKQFKFADN